MANYINGVTHNPDYKPRTLYDSGLHKGVRVAIIDAHPSRRRNAQGAYNLRIVKCNDLIDPVKYPYQVETDPDLTEKCENSTQIFNAKTGKAVVSKDGVIATQVYHDREYSAEEVAFINKYLPDGVTIEGFAKAIEDRSKLPRNQQQMFGTFMAENAPVFNARLTFDETVPRAGHTELPNQVWTEDPNRPNRFEVSGVPYRESKDDVRAITDLPLGKVVYEKWGRSIGLSLDIPESSINPNVPKDYNASRVLDSWGKAPSSRSSFDYRAHKFNTEYVKGAYSTHFMRGEKDNNQSSRGTWVEPLYPEGHPLHFTYEEFATINDKLANSKTSFSLRADQRNMRNDYFQKTGSYANMPLLLNSNFLVGFAVAKERGLDPLAPENQPVLTQSTVPPSIGHAQQQPVSEQTQQAQPQVTPEPMPVSGTAPSVPEQPQAPEVVEGQIEFNLPEVETQTEVQTEVQTEAQTEAITENITELQNRNIEESADNSSEEFDNDPIDYGDEVDLPI